MSSIDKKNKPALVPFDIARETFKQVALRRVEPTPDNYQLIYNEIAGIPVKETLNNAMLKALKNLPNETTEQNKWISRWEKLLKQENWIGLPALLSDGMDTSVTFSKLWPDAIRELLVSWDAKQVGLDILRKKEALERVLINFGNDPLLAQKIQSMAGSWKLYGVKEASLQVSTIVDDKTPIDGTESQNPLAESSVELSSDSNLDLLKISDNDKKEVEQLKKIFRILQDMLRKSLHHGLIPKLEGYPELKEEALQIYILAEKEGNLKDWQNMTKQFKVLLERVEMIGANEDEMKQDLLRLLKLLIENISELVADDQWVRGQIAVVKTIISSPLDRIMIKDAEKSLKEVIFKQGTLKHSLTDAKNAFKTMITTFVDRLGHITDSTDTFQDKVGSYANKLSETDDIVQINVLLESLIEDTQTMQIDVVRSRETLLQQRNQVESSQDKIRKLQEELTLLSETVRIDQLTGVLNRRGLDDAMVREIARAERGGGQLSVALLDIDNFKVFNDSFGHNVGDSALQHLAKVIQETVRPTDIAARFGGEEFVILLPDTDLDQAVATLVRLQRALTKQFFLGNSERLLITFSAGVSLFNKNEDQATVLNRADQAMYLAKKKGKNRVMTEVDLSIAH